MSRGGADDNRTALVFNAGFRQPRFGEVTIVMTHHFHDAFDGEPVGVHVGYRHKDAHHFTAVVEVFIFFHFFDDNDLTIGRSHDHILSFAGKDSHRTSEEIDDDGEYDDKNSEDDIESERATLKKQPIVECCDHQKCGTGEHQRGASFVVQTMLLDFRELRHTCFIE